MFYYIYIEGKRNMENKFSQLKKGLAKTANFLSWKHFLNMFWQIYNTEYFLTIDKVSVVLRQYIFIFSKKLITVIIWVPLNMHSKSIKMFTQVLAVI